MKAPLTWPAAFLSPWAAGTAGTEGLSPAHARLVDTACHLPHGLPAPAGTVLDDIGQTGCIPASQCACVYNGATYTPGAVYSTDCTNW